MLFPVFILELKLERKRHMKFNTEQQLTCRLEKVKSPTLLKDPGIMGLILTQMSRSDS